MNNRSHGTPISKRSIGGRSPIQDPLDIQGSLPYPDRGGEGYETAPPETNPSPAMNPATPESKPEAAVAPSAAGETE